MGMKKVRGIDGLEQLMSLPDGPESVQEAMGVLLEVKSYGSDQKLVSPDILSDIIVACKSREEFLDLQYAAKNNESALLKACYGAFFYRLSNESAVNDDNNSFGQLRGHLDYLKARMFAFGFIRGLQQGTVLGTRPKGEVTASIVRHPSVVKLLLREPKVSTKVICRELDVVGEQLWWPRLEKKNRLWAGHDRESTVKMAISHARKEAKQQDIDNRLLALIRAVGDTGSAMDERLNPKRRAMGKRR